ncbi:hypothetical protein HanRHA438_Chr06g0257171 [Helianthus annuus]|nr:hypothetical protein HanRHA438_Chr06g0257171 [Helianthus annuus]
MNAPLTHNNQTHLFSFYPTNHSIYSYQTPPIKPSKGRITIHLLPNTMLNQLQLLAAATARVFFLYPIHPL